jgi:hypothetical protein
VNGSRQPRLYEISPEPSAEARSAIIEALEQVSEEDELPSPWAARARREAVDDGLA